MAGVGEEGFELIRELEDEGLEFVVVGGACAELYSEGQVRTGDIDIIVPERERPTFRDEMEERGFEPVSEEVGSTWEGVYDDRGLVLQIVGGHYSGGVQENVDLGEYGFGEGVLDSCLSSLEDVILNYLTECYRWGSRCLWAYLLLDAYHFNREESGVEYELDIEYLEEKMAEEGIPEKYLEEDFLQKLSRRGSR